MPLPILLLLALGIWSFAQPTDASLNLSASRSPTPPTPTFTSSVRATEVTRIQEATTGATGRASGRRPRRGASGSPDSTNPDPPAAPGNLVTRSGDRSVVLHWDAPSGSGLLGYNLYRALSTNGPLVELASVSVTSPHYVDFAVTNGQSYSYTVRAVTGAGESPDSPAASATPQAFASDDAFLDYVQHTGIDYFWYEADPTNGLIRDRSEPTSPCSIAAVGFGLTAITIGVDHGWLPRAAGRERVLTTLTTFWNGPQGTNRAGTIGYRGWFYHFLDMNNATRSGTSELSSIDTALFLAGVLHAKQYFTGPDTNEVAIRAAADAIYSRVDWSWMANGAASLTMGWMPESGFLASRWIGYDEGMILYVLGLGAATNPLPSAAWATWTRGYRWQTNYGYSYVGFQPLFGHQYSHCWIDFRHIADPYMLAKGITYFENSRRATLAQRAYAIADTYLRYGYGSNIWGFTACDGPNTNGFLGYSARGAPPPLNDDGTIAPTAPGGSLPFAHEFCLPTLRYLYDQYLTNIWCLYGFRDAFNLAARWWDPDVLGIDQGPIVIMAENYRNQNVWRRFMRNPEIQRGLESAGFTNLAFVNPLLRLAANSGICFLTWTAATGHTYQVEFSPDLERWFFSPTGFVAAPGLTTDVSWDDYGPPATDAAPQFTGQRFYRVFEMGGP